MTDRPHVWRYCGHDREFLPDEPDPWLVTHAETLRGFDGEECPAFDTWREAFDFALTLPSTPPRSEIP